MRHVKDVVFNGRLSILCQIKYFLNFLISYNY